MKKVRPIRPDELISPELTDDQRNLVEVFNELIQLEHSRRMEDTRKHGDPFCIKTTNTEVIGLLGKNLHIPFELRLLLIEKIADESPSDREKIDVFYKKLFHNMHVVKHYFRKHGWVVSYKDDSLVFELPENKSW
jgi:hypothetical protein